MTTNDLRDIARRYHLGGWFPRTLTWAADEIDRLQRENRDLSEARALADTEAERLRAVQGLQNVAIGNLKLGHEQDRAVCERMSTRHAVELRQQTEAAFRAGWEGRSGPNLSLPILSNAAWARYRATLSAAAREGW